MSGRRWWMRRRASQPEQTAFVLAGGGTRGAVQVGMLAALFERGIRPDRVYGASVGAVNAAAYAADPTADGVKRLEDVWVHLQPDDIFPKAARPRALDVLPAAFVGVLEQRPAKGVEMGLAVDRIEDTEIPLEVVVTSLTDGSESG